MLPFRKGGFVETTTGFTKVENVDGKAVVTPMPPMKREVKTEKYMAVKKELASPVKEEPGFNPFKRERSPCEAVPDGGDAKRSRVNYEQLCLSAKVALLWNLNGQFFVENEELVSGKKALQAANGKLLGENTSLQSQVTTLTNVKNRLEIEAVVSDGKMKLLESDITTLEHALERARSCHQDAVLKVVELQLAICKAEQAEHLSIGDVLSPASNALSTPSSVDGTAHTAQ